MRIGIIGLLHESNTFVSRPTTIDDFRSGALLDDPAEIAERFADAHHELGGFLERLGEQPEAETAPIFVARALPSGVVEAAAWRQLTEQMLQAVERAGPLDGVLVAPHGATVSQEHPDADGHWLSLLRSRLGPDCWIGGTLDLHANLSAAMVEACDFLTAYRSNPHLDQRQRGREAASLMIDAASGRSRPVMRAAFPPLIISIDRQDTAAPHLAEVYELAEQLRSQQLLSASLLLGFPYADVAEMGTAAIAVADGDPQRARQAADRLADALWQRRQQYRGSLIDIPAAVRQCQSLAKPVCLLDMGDNVGGGSMADSTSLASALADSPLRSFVCLHDAAAAEAARRAGAGGEAALQIGGRGESHSPPLQGTFRVLSTHDGRFSETAPRHGGMSQFDQGPTAVVQRGRLTVMITSRRMVPFSLQQLFSCDIDPGRFDVLVAKGVHAPLAAYREVCPSILRVNTPGTTCADMRRLHYQHRRKPLYPLEETASYRMRGDGR